MSEWYGELPERWSLKRVGTLFSENTSSNAALLSDIPMQFRFGEIVKKRIIEKDDAFLESIRRYVVVQPNDIMVNGLNLNYDFITQRVAIAHEKGCITPAYISLRPNCYINPMFACYLLKAMDGQKILNGLGTGIRLTLSFSELKKTYLPSPPLPEQDQIVRYLDWKVSQINRLINAKRQQIGLLQEQKRAVVNEAVTRSGEGWKYRRLKTLVRDINEKSSPKDNFYVGMENIISWTSEYIDTGINADGDSKTFAKGDILFGKLRPYLAKVYSPDLDGVCSGEFLVLRGFHGYLPFLKFFLLSYDFIMLVNASTYGAKMPRANWGFIGNCLMPFPPIEEQQTIVAYLDNRCSSINRIIAKLGAEITLLHEYRTRLISDVVTGKLDVRGVAVPEYEAVEEAGGIADEEEAEGDDDAD